VARTRRRARRLPVVLVALVLALAAVVGLVALLGARDSSTFAGAAGPGRLLPDGGDRHLPAGARDPTYASDPPASGAHVAAAVHRDGVALSNDQLLSALEAGNVVLLYGDTGQTRALRGLASAIAGPFDPAVAAAGQAVILDHRPRGAASPAGRTGVLALAWRHELAAASPGDPGLRTFAQFWLGRGAGAH
jgi:hypothetical protein